MRIQPFRRIIAEDYEEKDRGLIQKLAYNINTFAEEIVNVVNGKKITIDDNLNWSKKDITVTVDSSGKPTSDLSIKSDLDHSCQGILVIKVTDMVTPGKGPSGAPFVTFTENSGTISINNITNLTANNKYSLRFILF